MLYCPKCNAEYRDGFKVCVDCRVALISRASDNGQVDDKSAERSAQEQALQREFDELYGKGDEAYEAERFKDALKFLNKASQIYGDDPEVWNLLGLTYDALGCTREAWRSFKFALNADPNCLNTLWYSAEFLYDNEDYALALTMIERYIELETDPAERKEAESLREDIKYHLSSDDPGPPKFGATVDAAEEEEEEVPEDEFTVIDSFDEEDVSLEEEEEEWEDEPEPTTMDEEEFTADLTLQLTDRNSKCIFCGSPLPTDAPYCYNCKEPHLYEPLS